MPTLTRSDDIQFVMQPYRETLTLKKKSLLAQEVKYLAESHGQFVRLLASKEGKLDAIFSREPGYLLGESIWQHFHKPNDLIYCEEQADSHSVMLVVVQNASVYIDTIIPVKALRAELMPLLTGKHSYQVFLYGDVPITQTQDDADSRFLLPKEFVTQIVQLDEPVFMDLEVAEDNKLLPLNMALKSGHLNSYTFAIALVGILVFIALGVWWLTGSKSDEMVAADSLLPHHNPYADFNHATSTPDPSRQLKQLAQACDDILTLPGWQLEHLALQGQHVNFSLREDAGTYEELADWAASQHFFSHITVAGAEISQSMHLPKRQPAETIMPIEKTVAVLMDQVDELMTSQAVKFGHTYLHGRSKEARLTIEFTGVSPTMLSMIGTEFKGLPVQLVSVQADVKQGLLQGNIQLSVWGA